MGRKSRDKGGRFERRIKEVLSDYWGVEAMRTPGSGAMKTTSSFNTFQGDVVLADGSGFPFVVECKNQEAWDYHNIILGNSTISSYWEQVVEDSLRSEYLDPILIFTKNYASEFVILPYKKEIEELYTELQGLVVTTIINIVNRSNGEPERYKVIMTDLETFTDIDKKEYMKNYGSDNWNWREETKISKDKILIPKETILDNMDKYIKR